MFLEQIPGGNQSTGWIEVICGSMFSGKTEELIRRLKRVNFAQQDFLLFKPKIDNRYDEECVVSHNGASFQAIQIDSVEEIKNYHKNERIIAIDEAQFFSSAILGVVNNLAAKGVRVICAGLDMDFQANPFGPMPLLMASAEYVTKVHAICVSCGNLAQYSHRKTKAQEQVLVGAVEEYEPLCRTCYNKIKH